MIICYFLVVVRESAGHGRQYVIVIEDPINAIKIVWKEL